MFEETSFQAVSVFTMSAGEKSSFDAFFLVVTHRHFVGRAKVTLRTIPPSLNFGLSGWRSVSLFKTNTGSMFLNLMLLEITFPGRLEVTAVTVIYQPFMLGVGMSEDLTLLFGCEGTFITLEPEALVLSLLVSDHIGDVFRPEVTVSVLTPDQIVLITLVSGLAWLQILLLVLLAFLELLKLRILLQKELGDFSSGSFLLKR